MAARTSLAPARFPCCRPGMMPGWWGTSRWWSSTFPAWSITPRRREVPEGDCTTRVFSALAAYDWNAAFRLPPVRQECDAGYPEDFLMGGRFGSVSAAFLVISKKLQSALLVPPW